MSPPLEEPHRLIRVEHIMGTAIGIDVRDEGLDPGALDGAFAWLRRVDELFSPYKPDSEISRIGRCELRESVASPDVRWVLALCDDLSRTSRGYFDARRHRADGRVDPSGLVKGWALEEAAWMLESAGVANFAINGGGDVVIRGEAEPARAWRVGIRHPRLPDRVAAVLAVRDLAVATSGGYERGGHIIDPHTGLAPTGLLSLTVVGPSLTYADVYATTAFAMGVEGPAWVAEHDGCGAYAITSDDRVVRTPLIGELLVDPACSVAG